MTSKYEEATRRLQKSLSSGNKYTASFELVRSGSGVYRVYFQGEPTGLYAGGGGYCKTGCCIGQVGMLLVDENIYQYDDTITMDYKMKMEEGISGGGDECGLVDAIAYWVGRLNNKTVIGSYNQTKLGYFVSFAIIDK